MFFHRRHTAPEITANQAEEVRSLADPDDWLLSLFGSIPTAAGVAITPTTAMRCAAVRAAVQAISEAAGQLPLTIVEKGASGQRRVKEGHPLSPVLNAVANEWTSACQLREQLVQDALLHGNGFLWIGRDALGTVRELIRIRPVDMQVDEDATELLGPPVYRLQGKLVDRRDLIHLRCPLGSTGASGHSPVEDCKEAIALALVLEQAASSLFGNASRPGGILSFPDTVPPAKLVERQKLWKATYGRVGQGGTAVVDGGATFTQSEFKSTDAQFAELRAFQLAEIARAFRVPPVLLMDYARATWSNSSEMGRQFVNFTLQPWLLKIEAEFALKLFTPEDRARLCLEHDIDQLVNANPLDRAQAAQAFRSAGVMTANELRAVENLPPRPDGDSLGSPYTTSNTDAAPADKPVDQPDDQPEDNTDA